MASKKKTSKPQADKVQKSQSQTQNQPEQPQKPEKPAQRRKTVAPKVFTLLIVIFIGISALVGLGYVELPKQATDIEILGQDAYEKQPRTPLVARSERPENMTETSIQLLDAPEEPTQVEVQVKSTSEESTNLVTEINELKQVVEGQQQMLRMVNQKQEQLIATHQAQMLKMGEAFNKLRSQIKQTDTTSLEKHIARLYLLQGVDRLYQQWQDGILLPDTIDGWAQQAAAGGFREAQSLGIALASMIEADGLLNEQELYRRVIGLRDAYLASEEAAEEAKIEEGGFWAYIKAKLRALIQIDRIDATADLSEELIAPLKSGDIPTFWQVVSKVEAEDTTTLTTKVRQLVEAHTSQKYSFGTLYQALAIQPQPKVTAVVVSPEGVAKPKAVKEATEQPSDTQEAAE